MNELLFEIETERVSLQWKGPVERPAVGATLSAPGWLRVRRLRQDGYLRVRRRGLPAELKDHESSVEGPRLFEETQYHLWVLSKDGSTVRLVHRDPSLLQGLSSGPGSDMLSGTLNYRGQVGRSLFRIDVDGTAEVEFEVEVFPTKLDYRSDYDEMVAEVSSFLRGLALEYLRAAYRMALPAKTPVPSDVEWLTLLRSVLDDLEVAIRRVALQPARRLVREQRHVRPERVRRADAGLRRAVARGKGMGSWADAPWGHVRARVLESHPVESLDTPEHRWLRVQLTEVRRRVASFLRDERARNWRAEESPRQKALLEELAAMESRVAELLTTEPLAAAGGQPPANFASLLLQARTGYREAYRAVLILRLGLHIEGGPMGLSLKDIHLLYEYWCYLAVLQLLSEELGVAIEPSQILKPSGRGLRVDLERGVSKEIRLLPAGQRGAPAVVASYNPSFDTPTGRHRPDVGLSIRLTGWETPFEILLDAKYRVDASAEYVRRHHTPGPPEDAVNALHRYRDAILYYTADKEPSRRIITGVALFPLLDEENPWQENTFSESLEKVGIGALPFLPGRRDEVHAWLRSLLRKSGWSMADAAIDHRASGERHRWRRLASEAVLIAVLRPRVDHLRWIRENRLYYAPLARLGPRRFVARRIAFYEPQGNEQGPGAVTHEAEVIGVDVMLRREIKTPWRTQKPNEPVVVYRLGDLVARNHPIPVPGGMRSFRWASSLSLDRARAAEELYLETEPEWRLYEELRVRRIPFTVSPGDARVVDPEDPQGRAVFRIGRCQVRYAGAAGYRLRDQARERYYASVSDLLRSTS